MGENMKKLQSDRHYLQNVLSSALEEVRRHGTLETLKGNTGRHDQHKRGMEDTITRCGEGERRGEGRGKRREGRGGEGRGGEGRVVIFIIGDKKV